MFKFKNIYLLTMIFCVVGCVSALDLPDMGSAFAPKIMPNGEHLFTLILTPENIKFYSGDKARAVNAMLSYHMAQSHFCESGYTITKRYMLGKDYIAEGHCK